MSTMEFTVKDLRYHTRRIVERLRRGESSTVTFRGRPVGRIVPLTRADRRIWRPIGYGMWNDRADLTDVTQWLDAQRKPRFAR